MSKYILSMFDTDGLKFCKADGKKISEGELDAIIEEINRELPGPMLIENDGLFDRVLIVKTKNYALLEGEKITIKGSALKATMKETALRDFLAESIRRLMFGADSESVLKLYNARVREISDLSDITPWCSKKTITDKVLKPKRTNEQRVLDALEGENIQEGDKVRMFFETPTKLCLQKNFTGVYDADKLYEKLYKTVKCLEPVLPEFDSLFLNYKLKRNKKALEAL